MCCFSEPTGFKHRAIFTCHGSAQRGEWLSFNPLVLHTHTTEIELEGLRVCTALSTCITDRTMDGSFTIVDYWRLYLLHLDGAVWQLWTWNYFLHLRQMLSEWSALCVHMVSLYLHSKSATFLIVLILLRRHFCCAGEKQHLRLFYRTSTAFLRIT